MNAAPSAAQRRRLPRGLVPWLALPIAAVVLATGLRAWAVEPFRIAYESMLPTLEPGDRVFVAKWRTPRRGDVVVLELAQRGPALATRDIAPGWRPERFVKRVVGLPGDVVASRSGRLWLNGARVDAWPTGEWIRDGRGRRLEGWRERLGGREFRVLRDPAVPIDDFDVVVPEGHVFVLGDHREHSSDSREIGAVPIDDVVGPAFVLYWPGDGRETHRIGDRIE